LRKITKHHSLKLAVLGENSPSVERERKFTCGSECGCHGPRRKSIKAATLVSRTSSFGLNLTFVMAGLVPAIHALIRLLPLRRGCPRQARA
ncbi:MAG: hypothetical protein WBA37_12735, partial [Xanthobacteraceae bacterium]